MPGLVPGVTWGGQLAEKFLFHNVGPSLSLSS